MTVNLNDKILAESRDYRNRDYELEITLNVPDAKAAQLRMPVDWQTGCQAL